MKLKSAPGHDGIVNSILKLSITHIKVPLTHIFNLSLKNGLFPNELKIAKVVPLYKKQDRAAVSNLTKGRKALILGRDAFIGK